MLTFQSDFIFGKEIIRQVANRIIYDQKENPGQKNYFFLIGINEVLKY